MNAQYNPSAGLPSILPCAGVEGDWNPALMRDPPDGELRRQAGGSQALVRRLCAECESAGDGCRRAQSPDA